MKSDPSVDAYIRQMRKLARRGSDPERDHSEADYLLCEVLALWAEELDRKEQAAKLLNAYYRISEGFVCEEN
jgi:hypothetical protein